jgi:hypothetical protein
MRAKRSIPSLIPSLLADPLLAKEGVNLARPVKLKFKRSETGVGGVDSGD